MNKPCDEIAALKAVQENIMSHSHYEQKVLLWRHIMNIYELFSRVQWQGRKVCGFQKLHCQRRPDSPRAKLVILSHADWCECIWMTVLTSPSTGSCLCDQLASELHFKESPIFIALTLEDNHLYAALAISFQCCNWRTQINEVFLHWRAAFFSENAGHDRHAEGQLQQRQRVFPQYYFFFFFTLENTYVLLLFTPTFEMPQRQPWLAGESSGLWTVSSTEGLRKWKKKMPIYF